MLQELKVLLLFLLVFGMVQLELTPSSDNWVDTTRLDAKIIETEGNYNEVFNDNVEAWFN